jgi:hypothetical protein
MQAPSASVLLAVWERARAQPISTQALMLLEAASPGASREDLVNLSVGRRDALLLSLREALFGSQLTGLTACPRCGLELEIVIEAADIQIGAGRCETGLITVNAGEYLARVRLPNSGDLQAIAEKSEPHSDEGTAIRRLLSRCLVELQVNGQAQDVDQGDALPQELIDQIASAMERADPQANVLLALDCAGCGHRWLSAFDIVSFLWNEVNEWATRVLREVCVLASAFGWRESDILAMSAQRRHLYIQAISEAN